MKLVLNNITYKYILSLIGLTYILYYTWFRFFRERLPKEIPFNLSIIGFICLLTILLVNIYILYRYFKPKTPHIIVLQILTYLSLIMKPLHIFDQTLKDNYYYLKLLHMFVRKCNKLTYNSYTSNIFSDKEFIFYMKYFIYPKMFMLVIFAIDIFYFHKLENYYYCIILGGYYLFWQYITYSIKNILEDLTVYLETRFVVFILPQEVDLENNYFTERDGFLQDDAYFGHSEEVCDELKFTSVRKFINAQSAAINFNNTPYIYTCMEKHEAREEYYVKYNIKDPHNEIGYYFEAIPGHDEISKALAIKFHLDMQIALDMTLFLADNMTNNYRIIRLNMLIIFCYLLCWSYILIVSLHTLNLFDVIDFLQNTYKYEQPF